MRRSLAVKKAVEQDFNNKVAMLVAEGFENVELVKSILNMSNGDIIAARKLLLGDDSLPSDLLKGNIEKESIEFGEQIMKNEKTCDSTIIIGKDRIPIKVHKAILSNVSPVFRKIYFPEEDKKEEIKKSDLEFPNFHTQEFNIFINYCYTEQIVISNLEDGMNFYKLVNFLEIHDIKPEIIKICSQLVNPKNAIFAFCATLQDPNLAEFSKIIINVICEKATDIFKIPNMLNNFSEDEVIALLKLRLKISEKTLFDRIVEYVEEKTQLQKTYKEKREVMSKILKIIRLDKIGTEGIAIALSKKYFKKDEIIRAMLMSAEIQTYFLPKDH